MLKAFVVCSLMAVTWAVQAQDDMALYREKIEKIKSRTETRSFIAVDQLNVVSNKALYEYVYKAGHCTLSELDGHHSLHLEGDKIFNQLTQQIDQFFTTGNSWEPPLSQCAKAMGS